MNHQWGWEKGPRRNSRLPKKHPFHSRLEALRTNVRLYKNWNSQTLETLSLFSPHLIVTLPLSLFFLLLLARKANIVFFCYLLSHKRASIKKTFLSFVNNGFSLFFELLNYEATHITGPAEDLAELCQSPASWIFQTQRGYGRAWQANSRKQLWYSRTQQPQQVLLLVTTSNRAPWLA